jgi:hypothetical protein
MGSPHSTLITVAIARALQSVSGNKKIEMDLDKQ